MGETSRVTKRRLQRFFENGLKRIRNNQADEYSETKTYAVGDYCIYNNTLYKCTKAVSTAGPFTASSWKQTTVASEIDSLYTNLEAHFSVDARLFEGASGVVCDNTDTGNITWENTTFFNTLTISGYVNNVNTSFFAVNIPYVASAEYCVPIFNNSELLMLIKITVNKVGSISWKSVYSGNKALSCYITRVFGV